MLEDGGKQTYHYPGTPVHSCGVVTPLRFSVSYLIVTARQLHHEEQVLWREVTGTHHTPQKQALLPTCHL